MNTVYVVESNATKTVCTNVQEMLEAVQGPCRRGDEVVVLYYDVPGYVGKDRESLAAWVEHRVMQDAPDHGVLLKGVNDGVDTQVKGY